MIFDKHTPKEILLLAEEEMAKTQAILSCAQKDLDSAKSKVGLMLSIIHHLKSRYGDKE